MTAVSVISPFSRFAEGEGLTRNLPLSCRTAATPDELAIHFAIREAVFVKEQGFFDGSDHDARDDDPSTIHVLALCGQVAGGVVRLYPLEEPGLWKGDRLAVLPDFRRRALGAPLVRYAVRTAGEAGGRRMIAHIQPQNVTFFERLGWHLVGEPGAFVGRIHQQMAIELQPPT